MKWKAPRKLAIWREAFPLQAAALRPGKAPRERKERKRLATTSKKRRQDSVEYAKKRIAFLGAHIYCQRPGCNKMATQVHHWAGRRSNYLKVETWRASCHDCNMFAKEHAAAAIAEGWRAPIGVYLT